MSKEQKTLMSKKSKNKNAIKNSFKIRLSNSRKRCENYPNNNYSIN